MAARMTKTGGAHARHLPRSRRGVSTTLISNVEDDVVPAGRVTGHAARHIVELEDMARPVRDVVISTRGVTAHADSTDKLTVRVVKPESAAKHVHTADSSADHRVVVTAVTIRTSAVRNVSRYRVAFLDRKSTRLNSSHLVISYAVFCWKKKIQILRLC